MDTVRICSIISASNSLFCMPASVALLQPAAHMPLHWPALTGLAAACSTALLLHRPMVTGCALLQDCCPLWCDHHSTDLVLLQGGQWSSAHLAVHCLGQQRSSTAGSCFIHHDQGMGGPGQDQLRLPNRSGGSHASQCVVEVHVPHFTVTAKLLTSLWLHQHPHCASCRRSKGPLCRPCQQPCQPLAGCFPNHQSRCGFKATGRPQQPRRP